MKHQFPSGWWEGPEVCDPCKVWNVVGPQVTGKTSHRRRLKPIALSRSAISFLPFSSQLEKRWSDSSTMRFLSTEDHLSASLLLEGSAEIDAGNSPSPLHDAPQSGFGAQPGHQLWEPSRDVWSLCYCQSCDPRTPDLLFWSSHFSWLSLTPAFFRRSRTSSMISSWCLMVGACTRMSSW